MPSCATRPRRRREYVDPPEGGPHVFAFASLRFAVREEVRLDVIVHQRLVLG
jgi:hypothetical protein